MTTVCLKAKKEQSLLRQHPWVFSGAIERIVLDADHQGGEPYEGELVCVESKSGDVLGWGHWQVGSIAVRILQFGSEAPAEGFWRERIGEAYKVREAIGLVRKDNDTYRLVHGEGDGLPGLIVDVYADTAVMQAHSVGMHLERKRIAEAIVAEVPQVEAVYYKSDDTLPFKAKIDGEKVGYIVDSRKSKTKSFGRRKTGWNLGLIGYGVRRRAFSLISVRTGPWWSVMQRVRMC